MTICLVNPPLVSQRDDFLGSGIPYLPHGLAYLAAVLRDAGHAVTVVDMFGEAPWQLCTTSRYVVQGISCHDASARIPSGTQVIAVYAGSIMAATLIEELLVLLRAEHPQALRIVFENTQAVTGFSLQHVAEKLCACGAQYVITGEAEARVPALITGAEADAAARIDGVWFLDNGALRGAPAASVIEDLDALPWPAWDLLPLANYWRLGYAHGPLHSGRYLAQLTSRGCPFNCRFCVVPSTNRRRWRARSAANVVDEMAFMSRRFGVAEFHWEDLNPTTSETRMQAVCSELRARKLHVTWKLVSGTKIETMQTATLDAMAAAGCRYVSFSPESGSPRVLQLMNKPFNHAHALELARHMRARGIFSQACFVIGFPGESDDDRRLTHQYIRRLVNAGVDEIAVFIMAPVPGSDVFPDFHGFSDLSQLTFSPSWRSDYPALAAWRRRLYRAFLIGKSLRHPLRVLAQCGRFVLHRFHTKMEMTPYRMLRVKAWLRTSRTL